MNTLLEESRQQLSLPLGDARRKLLIILNIVYIILVPVFLISEKLASGSFVPDNTLYLVYFPAVVLNIASAIYNIKFFRERFLNSKKGNHLNQGFIYTHRDKIDSLFGWLSILPIMVMSFCHLVGLGNPSNDAVLTDYALAHNLIIGVVMIIGRKAAIVWFIIVIGVLIWDVSRVGWEYEYHYLTPIEVANFKKGLENKEEWALKRNDDLIKQGLNPPKISRYFNTWLVFIIISFMGAYFFSGVTLDLIKIIPAVIRNIEGAIESSKQMDTELEHKKNELEHKRNEATKSAMRIVRYNETLEDINSEIEKLDYKDKKKLLGVIGKVRKALDKETDWENFETQFDSIHCDFFKTIQDRYQNLSQSELKHLAYIRMNLSSSEIARLMEVKKESLRTLRHRLKKKLNLNEDIDLRDFTLNIELI